MFFRYFSMTFIKCLFQIKSSAHLQENSSKRKVRQLSFLCLHPDSRRPWCSETPLPQGGFPSNALLGRSDKALSWTDRTAGHEDQPGCPSCLPKYSWSLETLLLQHRLLHQVTSPKERSTQGIQQAVLVSLFCLTSLRR